MPDAETRLLRKSSAAFRRLTFPVRDAYARRVCGYEEVIHGHCSICSEAAPYFLRSCRAHRLPRHGRDFDDADRHFSRDQHPGRQYRLAIYRAEHSGNGAAGYDVWRVFAVFQCHRHPRHGGADHRRHFDSKGLLSAGRQPRPRHFANRGRNELDPGADAARHPAANRGAIQRLERGRAADRALIGHAQRAAALRLRHLSAAPAARPHSWHYAADPGRRQVPADHGRYRSVEAAGEGSDAE